jgi:Tfp pilus assembly protein FimT
MKSAGVLTMRRVSGARRSPQGGFTWVDLVVAMQFMTIVAVTAVPVCQRTLQVYNLRGASREVYADLVRARMSAVMENHRYRVLVVDGYTYQLHSDTNNNGVIDGGETVLTRNLQHDCPHVQIAATTPIVFAPTGAARTPGTIVVSNEIAPSESRNVVVGTAGHVRIQ